MRRLIAIPCQGETLAATLDPAAGATALLIVSGGNEIRVGAHRGMALLAARLAERGVAVLRFDRRGVGDATGDNVGYAGSAPDIAAAADALRREQPHVRRLVALGNCDAASALALFGRAAGIDAIVLTNPWVIATPTGLPPAAAIRHRYAARLTDPGAWWGLLTGRVDLLRLAKGLRTIALPEAQQLADGVIAAIAAWGDDARIVLADGDATAIAFAAAAVARGLRTPTERIATASHSFAAPDAAEALESIVLRALTDGIAAPIPPTRVHRTSGVADDG